MVVSRIDDSVIYAELKGINPGDIKKESHLYQIMLDGLNIIIAIGNAKHTSKNITYFPIYLVKNDNSVIQIGLYEILTNKVDKYLDSNKKVKIELIGDPLIYNYVTKLMVQKIRRVPVSKIKDDDLSDDESEEEETNRTNKFIIPEIRKDIFILLPNMIIQKPRKEETAKDALSIRQKYHPSSTDIWINQYMQNPNYFIDIIEGNDKCFFTAIKDAYSSIGQQTTTEKLRNKLSNEITKEVYHRFKDSYEMFQEFELTCKTELKKLQLRNEELKKLFTMTIDRSMQQQYKQEGDNNLTEFEKMKKEKRLVDSYLHEYRFLKGVKTIEDFKKKIKTCDFWAETWAVFTMELLLNVKIIILSGDIFKQGDINNVLTCGTNQMTEIFQPEYYIILNHSKDGYQLISYKNRKIFKYRELPYDLRKMILDKCIEENAGGFAMIPEFVNEYKNRSNYNNNPIENVENIKHASLFDDNIVFRFYEKSANNKPGKNNGEQLPHEFVFEYSELADIPNWRLKLTNSWEQPFILDGHKWTSVEHYYQASKFRKNDPDFYLDFSLDSKTELSKNVDMAKAAGNDSGKYMGKMIREKHVFVDPLFYSSNNKNKILHAAQYAKYSQNKDLLHILLSTKKAKLIYQKKNTKPEICYDLMIVRNELNKTL
jgi:predicted NAD-dependent protein-ADP-ribosyltransferase YbiA (DUF1768 family)